MSKDKYRDYPFDDDCRALDQQLDQTVSFYARKMKSAGAGSGVRAECRAKTDRAVKSLNSRKRKALGLSTGSAIRVNGKRGSISGWSQRGFPIVDGGHAMLFEDLTVDREDNE